MATNVEAINRFFEKYGIQEKDYVAITFYSGQPLPSILVNQPKLEELTQKATTDIKPYGEKCHVLFELDDVQVSGFLK